MKDRNPGMEIDAIGGPSIARAGANIVRSREGLAVVGLAEGILSLPTHLRVLKQIRTLLASRPYDLVVLVDYPGFHLKVAAAACAYGIPVLYYIAPQLWAWGPWRMRTMRRNVSMVAAVLPFEADYFHRKSVVAEYVGHPLLDRKDLPTGESARASLGLPRDAKVLGLLPGSRKPEVDRLWPCFRDAARILCEKDPELHTIVAAVEGIEYRNHPDLAFHVTDSASVIAAANAVLCKSGTATLEAAIADTPLVVAYRMNAMTYRIAKWAVRIPHVSLVNLIAEREVCPELLQSDASPRCLAAAVGPLLVPEGYEAKKQRRDFAEVRSRLGGPGASERVAELVEQMVVR